MTTYQRFQDCKRQRRGRFYIAWFQVVVIGLYLSACTYPSVAPTLEPISTFVTLLPFTLTSTTAPPSNTPTDTPIIATLTSEPSLTSPPPTPSCGAPAGWVIYTVRPGDNLFRLGIKTNVDVDEVKFANCLTSDIIFVGDQLYLPFVPPTDIPVLPTAIPPSPCPSALSCPGSGLPPLVVAPGGGNDPTFAPCAPNDTNRIQAASLIIELGERIYFFSCNFPSPPVSAAVILSNGTIQTLTLLDPLTVNRDLITSTIIHASTGDVEYKAQAVFEWAAVPMAGSAPPIGTHSIIITSGDGSKEERRFKVNPPTKKHILVMPHAAAPGTTFQVYYIYFDINTNPTFELFGETERSNVRGQHTLTYRGQWTVPITNSLPGSSDKGWAQLSLPSAASDPRVAYSVSYNQNEVYTLFWLE